MKFNTLAFVALALASACSANNQKETEAALANDTLRTDTSAVTAANNQHSVVAAEQNTNNAPSNFTHHINTATGDLNKDNLPDKVVVTQDTLQDNRPYRLQVFFQEAGGSYKLMGSSDKVINAQYENGKDGFQTGEEFYDVKIKNGTFSVNSGLLRGHYEQVFRYQNNKFELIGFSSTSSNGRGIIESTDFNLSTGVKIVTEENYETDKIISKTKVKLLIRPLPNLNDTEPFDSRLFKDITE